jgi:protocatechuate 4,5-dioxygenase, alpha chain
MKHMIIHLFIFCNGLGILALIPSPICRRFDMPATANGYIIEGTTPFDGDMAKKGYALNKMCYSFNDKANRDAYVADPEVYMKKFGLNEQQTLAMRSGQVLQMLAAGGNAYYLAKFAGIFGLNMQDIGAQQTGLSVEQFKAKLVAANHQPV